MEATKKLNGKAVGKWLSNNAIIMMTLAIDTAIRVSFCADNTPEDVDAFLNRFEDGMKHLQRIKK